MISSHGSLVCSWHRFQSAGVAINLRARFFLSAECRGRPSFSLQGTEAVHWVFCWLLLFFLFLFVFPLQSTPNVWYMGLRGDLRGWTGWGIWRCAGGGSDDIHGDSKSENKRWAQRPHYLQTERHYTSSVRRRSPCPPVPPQIEHRWQVTGGLLLRDGLQASLVGPTSILAQTLATYLSSDN